MRPDGDVVIAGLRNPIPASVFDAVLSKSCVSLTCVEEIVTLFSTRSPARIVEASHVPRELLDPPPSLRWPDLLRNGDAFRLWDRVVCRRGDNPEGPKYALLGVFVLGIPDTLPSASAAPPRVRKRGPMKSFRYLREGVSCSWAPHPHELYPWVYTMPRGCYSAWFQYQSVASGAR